MRIPLLIAGAVCCSLAMTAVFARSGMRSTYGGTAATVVDDKGNIRVPADYRTDYQVLSS